MNISHVANLPSRFGEFKIQSFQEGTKEHLVIFKEPMSDIPFVRIHSECLTGDALGSLKCDCGEQLNHALKIIANHGGMVIYLRQEGRNIGLFNKVNAYALQDTGLNTIDANHQLGFRDDERTYEIAEEILRYFHIEQIRLITNNPLKINALKTIEVVERIPSIMASNRYNDNYLKTKKKCMGHIF
jgi:GTP cyclohydrolase II